MSNAVQLTCRRCGNQWTKELRDDEMIGPHKDIKQGVGLSQRQPNDTVTRKRGYGTMPVVVCDVCGGHQHDISAVDDE